jgi:outer membrane receptor protein involved in Fe transport
MIKRHPKAGLRALTMTTSLAAGLCLTPGIALAQDAASAQTEDNEPEAIVVTATRREQALQNTPIAISAVSAAQLERQIIANTSDLQRVSPSLVVRSSSSETGGTTVRIRGVGTQGNNPGLEGAVGIFIDGVYRQRAGLAMNNLFDVQRVEVLRGPQGTLFGKNTSAGAISIQPRTPLLSEFEGSARAGIGNFGNLEFDGMINFPIGETMALRVSGAGQVRDGYVENIVTGLESHDRDRLLGRAMLLWEPTPNASLRVTLDAARKDEMCCAATYRIIGPATTLAASLSGVTLPNSAEQRIAATNATRPFLDATDDFGAAVHGKFDLGAMTLKTIIAHRTFDAKASLDVDYSPADILYQNTTQSQSLTTYEATLNGQWGRLDWLVGAFAATEDVSITNQTRYGAQLAPLITPLSGGVISPAAATALYPVNGGTTASEFSQGSDSWSFFLHNQLQVTDRLGAVFGLRYNHEEKVGGMDRLTTLSPSCGGGPFHGQGAAPPSGLPSTLRLLCPRPTYQASTDENETTGTAGVNFKFTEALFAYASYSRGYKAGGINLDRDAPAAAGINATSGLVNATQAQVNAAVVFKPEFSESYEIGLRGEFFDRTLIANVTAFQTDFTDFQLNTFNGTGFAISNAGSVQSKGVELEGSWRPTRAWTIGFGAVNLDARYGNDPLLKFDPPDQLPAPNQDLPLAGRVLDGAPQWTVNLSARHEFAISGSLTAFIDVAANYRTEYNTASDLVKAKIQPAHTLVNARIGLFQSDADGLELTLWGTNLTDEYTQTTAFDSVFQNGSLSEFPGALRMWGITIKKAF